MHPNSHPSKMNTKTMRLPPRRVVTSSSNKRKEREGNDSLEPLASQQPHPPPHLNQQPAGSAQAGSGKPNSQLMAGYLAHEFLTRGTLLGKPLDPAPAKPIEGESRRRRYVEVSSLLKARDGAHLPGIVNPTQLDRLLQ